MSAWKSSEFLARAAQNVFENENRDSPSSKFAIRRLWQASSWADEDDIQDDEVFINWEDEMNLAVLLLGDFDDFFAGDYERMSMKDISKIAKYVY